MAVAPPRPAPETVDPDALVREARARQRRRQAGMVAGLVLLGAAAYGAYAITVGTSGASTVWAHGRLSAAAAAACAGPAPPVRGSPDGLNSPRRVGPVL